MTGLLHIVAAIIVGILLTIAIRKYFPDKEIGVWLIALAWVLVLGWIFFRIPGPFAAEAFILDKREQCRSVADMLKHDWRHDAAERGRLVAWYAKNCREARR